MRERFAGGAIGFSVGGDDALVDASGRFDLNVTITGEKRRDPRGLLVGEKTGVGVQGLPGAVERVILKAAAPMQALLNASPTKRTT